MTSFSNSPVERGLDAMLIVYSLLSNHLVEGVTCHSDEQLEKSAAA
jgi:hypothetical protein